MDLNTIVENTFSELLNNAGFSILEDNKSEVCFKSENVTIRFISYSNDDEYYYFIKLNDQEREYEDFQLERYFETSKKMNF